MIPVFAAAVALVHSLPLPGLVLSRAAANSIFLGTLVGWEDPRIQATDPGGALPGALMIVRLVRADSSGTTQAFARALASFANTGGQWGASSYWNAHPLRGSSLPTWPAANYSGLPPTTTCARCARVPSRVLYSLPRVLACVRATVRASERAHCAALVRRRRAGLQSGRLGPNRGPPLRPRRRTLRGRRGRLPLPAR